MPKVRVLLGACDKNTRSSLAVRGGTLKQSWRRKLENGRTESTPIDRNTMETLNSEELLELDFVAV